MITILLPVYNDEKYLRYTLESLKNQTFGEYTCLIGFNGTIDRSKEIAQNIISNDARFRIIDYGQENGKSLTLNKLLNLVETDYIGLIDGDDVWHPNKLEEQIILVDKYDVVGTLTCYINNRNEVTNPRLSLFEKDADIKEAFKRGNNQIVNSSSVFRFQHAREIGGWDQSVEGLEDFDFWLKLAKSKKTFYNIQKVLVSHRVHTESNFNTKHQPANIADLLIKNEINTNTILC